MCLKGCISHSEITVSPISGRGGTKKNKQCLCALHTLRGVILLHLYVRDSSPALHGAARDAAHLTAVRLRAPDTPSGAFALPNLARGKTIPSPTNLESLVDQSKAPPPAVKVLSREGESKRCCGGTG
jgi:hypothetical protein